MSKMPAIPYMGSKRSIAEDIVKVIRMRHPNAKYFYDVFGGGGAVSIQALSKGFTVYYNEIQERVANLMQFLKDLKGDGLPLEWYNWVTREEFKSVINSDRVDAYSGMVQQCWSFGNSGKGYIFGETIERQKELLSKVIVNKCEVSKELLKKEFNLDFPTPKEEKIYDRYIKEYKAWWRVVMDKRKDLQQLEQIQNLQRLQRFEQIQRLFITSLSYQDIKINTPIDETVVYCDPPYRGTAKYRTGDFDHKAFDDWFKSLSCPAYMSEYRAPFDIVWSVKKRCLFAQTTKENTTYKQENIYYNGFSK